MSILNEVRTQVANDNAAAANASGNAKPARESSKIWLNVGITLAGAGEDGEDLFVSLPVGIPLDDMKPQQIRGSKESWVQLAQTKNALLEAVQKAGSQLEAGERQILSELSVEVYRKAEPAQEGTVETNPLLGALFAQLGGKKAA